MEIDINRMANFGGFDGVQGLEAGGAAEKAGRLPGAGADPLTISLSASAPSDGIAEVPDSAMTRDDDLGRIIGPCFRLPAPPMPVFE